VVAKKRVEVSWLRGGESVMSQCVTSLNLMRWLIGREPVKMLKDGR